MVNLKDYNSEYPYGSDNFVFENNSSIYDAIKEDYLTISEVIDLKLFINPIDSKVWQLKESEFVINTRFEYESY